LATFYTIGHSTRSLDELIAVLKAHSIQTLVDIRCFPQSRRLPHFNRENLERSLPNADIRYQWLKTLGGYRKKIRDDSPNVGLRNQSFRNYADHMLTGNFKEGIANLQKVAEQCRTAYMCAERSYFQCHRRLVSDYLTTHGHQVLHIYGDGPAQPHQLTAEANLVNGEMIYGGHLLF